MLEAIIFDMDGVLVKSTGANRKAFAKVFENHGIDIQQSDQKKYLGRGLSDQREMREKEYNIQKYISLEQFREEALKYQLEFMKDILKPDIFVQKFIQEAKNQGIKIAVATSSSKKRAIQLLKLVEVYDQLNAFTTCDDVEKSKPEPDLFIKAAEILGVEPKNCIVIEDAVNGIQAAKAAGMKSAGKIGPHHTKEELSIAELTFSDFSEISLDDLEKVFL